MVLVLATISAAFAPACSPISSVAMARAEAVRLSVAIGRALAHLDYNMIATHSYDQYLQAVTALDLGADGRKEADGWSSTLWSSTTMTTPRISRSSARKALTGASRPRTTSPTMTVVG